MSTARTCTLGYSNITWFINDLFFKHRLIVTRRVRDKWWNTCLYRGSDGILTVQQFNLKLYICIHYRCRLAQFVNSSSHTGNSSTEVDVDILSALASAPAMWYTHHKQRRINTYSMNLHSLQKEPTATLLLVVRSIAENTKIKYTKK